MNPDEELELEDDPDEEEEELEEEQAPETPPEPETAEAKNERLERELNDEKRARAAAESVATTLRELRPSEQPREGVPVKRELSKDEIEELNNKLQVELATNPLGVIQMIQKNTREEVLREVQGSQSPMAEAAADAIIERYERKLRKENPLVAEKVAPLYRAAIDKTPASERAKLINANADLQEQVLGNIWYAEQGKYLGALARPKKVGQSGADTGGRSMGELQARREARGFRFSSSQREAMERAGLSKEKIDAREKQLREGIAS